MSFPVDANLTESRRKHHLEFTSTQKHQLTKMKAGSRDADSLISFNYWTVEGKRAAPMEPLDHTHTHSADWLQRWALNQLTV